MHLMTTCLVTRSHSYEPTALSPCSMQDYVRLDTMVTVVDASRFQGLMRTTCLPGPGVASAAAGPADAGHANSIAAEAGAQQQLDPEDQRPLAELLAEQVREGKCCWGSCCHCVSAVHVLQMHVPRDCAQQPWGVEAASS